MALNKTTFIVLLLIVFHSFVYAQEEQAACLPAKGKLIYQSSLADRKSVADWIMEGPGTLKFNAGWMEMYAPHEKWHHVFWCPRTFPSDFIAEWDVRVLKKEGLLIVFFAAKGDKGQSIFDPGMPERDGTFKYYNRGKIHCYHISYYANNPKHPDRGDSHLRKDPGNVLLQTGEEGISVGSSAKHHMKLIKKGGHIIMFVDNKKIIEYTDEGKTNGPVYTSGHIGFRQMKWTDCEYRNFKVWEIKSL